MKRSVFTLIFMSILVPYCGYTQNLQSDWLPWDNKEKISSVKIDYNKISVKKIIISPIKIYKKTLSRQDGEKCNFVPSCSDFAFMAIKQKGIITGCLLAADRLTRCHPFASGEYKIFKNKLFDPVKNYDF